MRLLRALAVLKFCDLGTCSHAINRNVAAAASAHQEDPILWENVLAQAELGAVPLSDGMKRENFSFEMRTGTIISLSPQGNCD